MYSREERGKKDYYYEYVLTKSAAKSNVHIFIESKLSFSLRVRSTDRMYGIRTMKNLKLEGKEEGR